MKIIYVIHSLNVGGAETIVTEYIKCLHDIGHDVVLLELAHVDSFLYEELKKYGIKIITALPQGKSRLYNFLYVRFMLSNTVNSIIRDINPDIVHMHTYSWFVNLNSIPSHRIFYTLHCTFESFITYIPQWAKNKYLKFIKSGINFIVLSKSIKQSICKYEPNLQPIVLPNGIDIDSIQDNSYDRKWLIENYKLDDNVFIVGHVGRYNPVKNHKKIIEVFSIIHEENPNSILVLVGDGNAVERERVNSMIGKYDLSKNVLQLGLRKDASLIIGAFDLFLMPSISEAFPLVAVEAQANNVNCLFSDAIPEELLLNKNCIRLSVNESSEKWYKSAELLTSDVLSEDIYKLDVKNVINLHLQYYKQSYEKKDTFIYR